MYIPASIESVPAHLLVAGSALIFLLLIFFLIFLVPGIWHWFRLLGIKLRIAKLPPQTPASEFKKVFAKDKRLSHLWKEYQDSLHTQLEDRDGHAVVAAERATVPAETFFNSQFVVDTRLRSEFFKHLPGMFTGIGIIGTFSGLIQGLRQFQVSENTATVRNSLEGLMHLVGEAFLISAAAITTAMVVTFLEKLLLASLYRSTEIIAQEIDARFEAGAGEEYLSRLVKASEDSASQAKILKDALVTELGELLRELTKAQIISSKKQQAQLITHLTEASQQQAEAARQDKEALAAAIAESIKTSLKGPLEDISEVVKSASGDQSASAVRMLQDVMTSFSQRLNDLFGGQISGLSELNQKTANSVQDAVASLRTLVENIEASSSRATESMADRMAQAIEKMEKRQEAMNSQSTAFVEQIRQLVATTQSESNSKLQSTLETIGNQVAGMLDTLASSQEKVSERNQQREHELAVGTQRAVAGMSESVEVALREITAATQQIAHKVTAAQSETNMEIQAILETVSEKVSVMLDTMSFSQEQANLRSQEQDRLLAEGTQKAVNGMSQSVELAIKEIGAATQQMAQNVTALTQATDASIGRMEAGAALLGSASSDFAEAGRHVVDVIGQAVDVSAKLSETSSVLSAGGAALQDLLRDYRAQREATASLLADLRAMVETARREASLTGDILNRIEGSATRLGQAQKQADDYLEGVSRVLGEAHTSFANEVKRTLDKANIEFHTRLAQAVGLLSSEIDELGLTLASMGAMTPGGK